MTFSFFKKRGLFWSLAILFGQSCPRMMSFGKLTMPERAKRFRKASVFVFKYYVQLPAAVQLWTAVAVPYCTPDGGIAVVRCSTVSDSAGQAGGTDHVINFPVFFTASSALYFRMTCPLISEMFSPC